MTPTIVVKDGKVVLVTGSPGGRTIINTVSQRRARRDRVRADGPRRRSIAARLHHQWLPDRVTIEGHEHGRQLRSEHVGPAAVATKFEAMRQHDVRTDGRQGDAHSIWVAPDGTPYGVNDKRTADSKASVPAHLTAPATRR